MMKYEEEHYLYENIKDKIYPWVKESLVDHKALNGKYISDKDTPIVSFAGDLMVIFDSILTKFFRRIRTWNCFTIQRARILQGM